jgi:succinoglycan biosynthesis transport protein ExoP
MSQEIQISNKNLPLQPAFGPHPTGLAPAGLSEPTPLRRMHQLLRGRYWLAVVLGTIGAAAGATAGFLLPKPSYQSAATIKINPIVPLPGVEDKVLPLYQNYLANVMVELRSEPVVREAMESPAWKQVRPYPGDVPPPEQVTQFVSNLTVKSMPFAPEMIQVIYDDNHKDAKEVAQVAVRSVLDAFKSRFIDNDEESTRLKEKINHNINEKDTDERLIAENQAAIAELNKQIGGDGGTLVKAHDDMMISIQKDLGEAKKLLEDAQRDQTRRNKGQEVLQPYTDQEIARVSPDFSHKLDMAADAYNNYQYYLTRFGSAYPETKDAQIRLSSWQKSITDAKKEFNDNFFIEERGDGAPGRPIQKNLEKLKDAADRLQAAYDHESDEVRRLVGLQSQIQQHRDIIDGLKTKIAEASKLLDVFQFEQAMTGRYTVDDPGTTPMPGGDRRPVFAALGLFGGAALPVGFLLLVGLANPRYRFSDETGREVNGLNLLGILPDLPDRLSDPEQASIAAHCVHQIRTMLQISGAPEERRVFAITSAAPGDGKTSLTLALGLSYAACGARTLLIDCDLVGAGLTSRMNVSSPAGVLEAIANRSLVEYVRSTDVADVTILPVGSAQTLHASTLSPAALRRLIDEARKQYDTILIDTGPILGSIEAALVCAAADATVLTVARGQQRPLVERAITRLMGIGARLAGVVFNRAQSGDFDRSISGASSLRSAAAGTGHNGNGNGGRYGTLGRAVHSHYSRQSDINQG